MKRNLASWCVVMLLAGSAAARAQDDGVPAPPTTDVPETAAASPDADHQALRDEIATMRQTMRSLQDRLDAMESDAESLESKIDSLVRSNATLLDRMESMASSGNNGLGLLGNLDTDPDLRDRFVGASNPEAAVRFYNWNGKTTRMNVNGIWYNLKPGPNTITVPYGPVAVTHCDKQNPRTFSDWTSVNGGYVMVFDVEDSNGR